MVGGSLLNFAELKLWNSLELALESELIPLFSKSNFRTMFGQDSRCKFKHRNDHHFQNYIFFRVRFDEPSYYVSFHLVCNENLITYRFSGINFDSLILQSQY